MAATSELYFDFLCRTCINEAAESVAFDAKVDLTAEQSELQCRSTVTTALPESSTMRIIDLLVTAMPQLQANINDELPQKICRICLGQLLNIFRFQHMCTESDQQLRSLLATKYTDIKISSPMSLAETLLDSKEFARSKVMVEGRVAEINTDPFNILLKASPTNGNDPLQSAGEAINICKKDEQISDSGCLKTELCDEDSGNDDNAEFENMITQSYSQDVRVKIEKGKSIAQQDTTTTRLEVLSKEDVDSVYRKARGSKQTDKITKVKAKKSSDLLKAYTPRQKKADIQSEDYSHNFGRQCNKPEMLPKQKQTHSDKVEMKERIFACDICGRNYTSQRTLTRHRSQRHCSEDAAKLHVCKFCNKSFQQAGTLKDHIRTHTGEQPYLCSECGRAFKCSSNMKQHLLRHAGVKRYECPDCPKKFACLSDLASHKAVHNQIKSHVCDICGSAFGKPYQLKKHKMYHNGEKPHKCEYCEMRFVCMDHQRRHMRTHTGEKPYKCKYCERAFAQSNDLVKHLRIHLGENVYKCELCPCGFRLAAELRIHFALHKNDDKETQVRNRQALEEEDVNVRLNLITKQPLAPIVESVEQPQTTAKYPSASCKAEISSRKQLQKKIGKKGIQSN